MITESTVFVVDDDPGARRSMRWLLESDGFSVETYSSASDFLAACDRSRPGCLVLDLKMPGMDGLELQQKLQALGFRIPIIFISGQGDVPKCALAMKGGAVDFLEKPADDQRVLDLIRQALEKDGKRRRAEASQPELTARIVQLTPRERDVLHHLYQGDTIKAIAAKFGVSFQTVAKHRARGLEKLEVDNEAELVRLLGDVPLDG